jgi:hypothetical protein
MMWPTSQQNTPTRTIARMEERTTLSLQQLIISPINPTKFITLQDWKHLIAPDCKCLVIVLKNTAPHLL